MILDEGKSEQDLWILVKGTLRGRQKEQEQDRTARWPRSKPGAAFGEMSFFQKAPHSATVRAVERVKVLRTDSRKLRAAADEQPVSRLQDLLQRRWRVMAQRLRRHGRMDLRVRRAPGGSQSPRRMARLPRQALRRLAILRRDDGSRLEAALTQILRWPILAVMNVGLQAPAPADLAEYARKTASRATGRAAVGRCHRRPEK